MSDYRFCVSLHVSHPTMDLKVLTDVLGVKPKRLCKVGEPRFTPKGNPLDGVYKRSLWSAPMHSEKRLYSENIHLEDYLASLNKTLAPHKNRFNSIVESGGYMEYFIGWFSEGNISVCLNPKLMYETSELGVSIGLDIYPQEV